MIAFEGREYHVYGDPCHWSTTRPDTPPTTVDELVDALANQASREASAPEKITVDGYAGKKVILHMAAGAASLTGSWQGDVVMVGRIVTMDDPPIAEGSSSKRAL